MHHTILYMHQSHMFRITLRFQDSAAGIVTRIRAVGSVIRTPVTANIFLLSKMSRTTPEPFQPPIKWGAGFFTRSKAAGARS
jgi:hypothetical protein